MDTRKVILLVGALLVAAVTAFMARSMFAESGTPAPTAVAAQAPTGPGVLVATRALPVGTIITADSFRFQPWPDELVEGSYFIRGQANIEELIGTVVRNEITAGQPVTQGALVRPGDRGFLAAALGPGMRAVAVPVSAESGVAGFVFAGDRVDLLLTQQVTGDDDARPLNVTETIVRNLRVLATDQRTTNERDEAGNLVPTVSTTVTVEATPRIAEKIAVALGIGGQLSLSLRSIADNTAELERAIASGEVDLPENQTPQQEREMLIEIAQRPADNDTTHVTGADVSRFQRSSVPRSTPSAAPATMASAAASQMVAEGIEAVPQGPSVRVARGNTVTQVPVRGN